MRTANPRTWVVVAGVLLLGGGVVAQDWPQWRGPNRDARAAGFKAPATWPKEMTQKWKVKVGNGVASPALVGDKLYVFTREGSDEALRCLDAGTGNELWKDKDAEDFKGKADGGFPGPRCSPTVADGKVVTLGVNGVLSCFDAASGKVLWRNEDFKGSYPSFHTASSPVIEGGLCVVQLGSGRNGGVFAYDLATGTEKWKWTGDGPAYASPDLLTLGGTKLVVAVTAQKAVALDAANGKLVWETGHTSRYNAISPLVDGATVVLSGSAQGVRAVKLEKDGDKVTGKELWSNKDIAAIYNTPVLRKGLLFGLTTRDALFCIDAETGKTAWTAPLAGGGGRSAGYGSVVDAGPVLMALNPGSHLVVFEPDGKEFKQLAKYKVGEADTYAYPVVSGNRVFVKDRDSVTLWALE